ncbi:DUF2946 family protein [Camelimonas sp. ID_303_24]
MRALFALVLAYALALQPLLMGAGVAHGAPGVSQILCGVDGVSAAGAKPADPHPAGDAPPAGGARASCCCLAAIGGPPVTRAAPIALPRAPEFARLTTPVIADLSSASAALARPSARPRAPPVHPAIAQAA